MSITTALSLIADFLFAPFFFEWSKSSNCISLNLGLFWIVLSFHRQWWDRGRKKQMVWSWTWIYTKAVILSVWRDWPLISNSHLKNKKHTTLVVVILVTRRREKKVIIYLEKERKMKSYWFCVELDRVRHNPVRRVLFSRRYAAIEKNKTWEA